MAETGAESKACGNKQADSEYQKNGVGKVARGCIVRTQICLFLLHIISAGDGRYGIARRPDQRKALQSLISSPFRS